MIYHDKDEAIVALRRAVEKRLGSGVNTPSEFKQLESDIKRVAKKGISTSTLMRLWGYVAGETRPYTTTLDILANYAGWQDFAAFCEGGDGVNDESGSDDVLSERLSVDTDLAPRDHVLVRWSGDHEVLMRHLGGAQFVVERSHNSKLAVGDTFTCHLIIQGAPLYLDNLVHLNLPPRCYICGKNNGISYEVIEN